MGKLIVMSPDPRFTKLADAWEGLANRPFICSEAAQLTRDALGEGVMKGYWSDSNPTALLGRSEGGHDFLVVDDHWILDFWAMAYYGFRPIYDIDTEADEIARLYGDQLKWETVKGEKMAETKLKGTSQWVNRWEVGSKTSDRVYIVGQRPNGSWGCSCPKWIFNKTKPRPDCHHIIGVKKIETNVMVELPVAFLEYQRSIDVEPAALGSRSKKMEVPLFLRQTTRSIILED